MTSILLHDYVEQVEKLIDDNRLVEAVEHCRHILQHYPRHIATYRVMGKALLEQQDYNGANDLFLRILGADPNDFISHVGLSIIYKEEGQYDQALWHLERAFEIQPYNVAIQGELRQLYAVETETRPGVIPLTKGALARLYMQGELYQQAISEIRRILVEEPERMDLKVLLAEALWRDDQRIDAEEICLGVLEELPNCIVINAILAEIWLQTGRIPEAQKYLKRLQLLTWQTRNSFEKESITGRAFATEGAFVLPEEAPLEFLETGTVVPSEAAKPADDWVGEVSFEDMPEADAEASDVVLEPESGMHSYDWLADIDGAPDGINEDETAVSNQQSSETDWFSQQSAKDALNLSTGELDADWLNDLRGEDNDTDEEPDFQPLTMDSDPGMPTVDSEGDWFTEEGDFSDELFAELADSTELTAKDEATVDSDHDWLKNLDDDTQSEDASEPREKSGIQIDATNLMDENLLDWDQIESEPHIVKEPKTPFWLSEMADEEMEAVELNPEEALDWLTVPDENAQAEGVAAEQISETEPATAAEKESDVADPLDWLNELADDAPIEVDADAVDAQFTEAAPDTVEESLDWLSEISGDADVEEVSESEDLEEGIGPTAVLGLTEQADLPAMPNLTDTDALGDADDWLAALTEDGFDDEPSLDTDEIGHEAEDIELDTTTAQFAALSDADDWLESASADLDAILEDIDDEEDTFPNLKIPDMEGPEIDDIPDWLNTDTLDQTEEAETAMSSDKDPQEKPQADEPEVESSETAVPEEEQDALDWLAELTDDEQPDADKPLEPPIATEGMPSWLDDDGQEKSVEVVDEWDSASADIPDWLQEPVPLSDLDDADLTEPDDTSEIGLTGLLSEMDVTEEAVSLDDMDLLSDWMDEDGDGSLTELLGEMELDELPNEPQDEVADLSEPDEQPQSFEPTAEAEEVGLTGLLSNLSLEDDLTEATVDEEDDFLASLLTEADDDDLSDFFADEAEIDVADDLDSLGLDELEDKDVSLTALFAEVEAETESEETAVPEAVADDDDWLSELEDAEPDTTPEEAEEELGLTGMLANLWPDDGDENLVEPTLPETAVSEPTEREQAPLATDDLGLTELLAGIDYDDDEAIDSRPEWPDIDEPVEPSLTEILTGIDMESAEDEDDAAPISAEDTTWLSQLEADTGKLQEQADEFDMAGETGLDWLTLPDEPEAEEAVPEEAELPESHAALDEPDVIVEQDSTPEDWDDAMSWLEELAAQQEDPVAELPSVAETMLDEELDSSEMRQADEADEADEAEAVFGGTDWLDDLTGDVTAPVEEAESEPAPLPDNDLMAEAPEASDETAVSLEENQEDEEFAADLFAQLDDDGEMSWLDELATDRLAETAVDELETVPEPAEASLPDADDASWLDELVTDESEQLPALELFADDPEDMETAVDESDISWLDTIIEDDSQEDVEETVATHDVTLDLDELVEDLSEIEAEEIAKPEIEPEGEEAYRVTGVTDALKADDGLDEVEADLEEALAWLDELDEEPAAEPVEEEEAPPTIITPPEPHELADELLLDVDEETPETILISPEPDELTLALDRLEQQVLDEGIAVPDTAVFPIQLSEDELNAALDWIEQAEAEPEPMPTRTEADEPTTEDASDEDGLSLMADDPEAWLEDLLSGDSALDIDMEPPPIKPSEDAMFVTDDAVDVTEEAVVADEPAIDAADSLLDEVELDGMPEDPDAAVAWLDQLVSGDDLLDIEMEPPPIKPSEDAMFVTDDALDVAEPAADAELTAEEDELETAVTTEASLEDDPEAWLEQLLSDDLAMDVEMEPPPIKPSEDAMFVTDDAVQAEAEVEEEIDAPSEVDGPALDVDEEAAAEAELALPDMEDDPEAWLEQMLSGEMDVEMEPPPIKPSEDAVYVTSDAPPAEEIVPSSELEATADPVEAVDDIIADVPDDPDEAMAWLEQLAARQGADLEELPSVTDATNLAEEPEMPSWMAQDLAEMDAVPEESVAETKPEREFGTLGEEISEASVDTGSLFDDVDEELPDWLEPDDTRPVVGETDWLQNLPDVDMDSWLSAEAEAVTADPAEDVQMPDTGPLRSQPTDTGPLLEDDLFEPVIEPSSGAYSVDEAKLGVAQEALANGRITDALNQYKALVNEGAGMMAIIAELEQAADAHPQTPALFQVLGDAYMRNGQLQKALAAYRSALNQM